ncbi:MAG: Sca4 family protein [Rickettsia endosymbiont of Pseudomimeciton antennatum]|nr:Sca4 family protein [Rickettsia endosymbiont of Pseudomimeciton antennatum]
MGKERNPREYFEYNADFLTEIKKIEKEKDDKKAESIAQSLFEVIKRTLKDSAISFNDKKNILEGFAETIRYNREKEPETIEVQSIVFDKFAEKLAKSIQDDEASTKIFQKYEEQLQAIVAATKPQKLAQDVIFLSEPEMEKPPIELDESFPDVDIPVSSAANRAIDPITRAIRTQILTKQRELIVTALVKNAIVKQEELNDLNKFRAYFENEQNKETISELLKTDKDLKQALEQVEIAGYKNVHTEFAGIFTTMEWQDGTVENASGITTRKQVVRDANNNEIATLAEATHKINPPHTVQKSDGTNVAIHNYRTIDFPITLENQNGPMHLSLAVKDQNGRNIAASKAVYFTAHYDDDGKLIEVSSPHPVKFSGNNPDAVGYIEHGGQIYTLPVTQEKYKAMMQEVAKNLGQGVDISPSIEAPDLTITSRQKIEETQPHRVQKNMVPIDIVEQENMVALDIVKREEVVLKVDIPEYSKDHQITREERIESVSGQKVKEAQPYKVQENMEPTNMVNKEAVILNVDIPVYPPISEKVRVTIEEKATEQQLYAPKISQTVLINSDIRDKAESIMASLQHIRPSTQKSEKDIPQLVGELSKNLEGKRFEKQKNYIETTLEELTPQEQRKLLQRLAETIADKRGKTLEQVDPGKKEHNIASVRLITENKTACEDGGIVKPQRKAEHVNVSGNVKLQMFLQNKINEVSKKPIIVPKTRNARSFHSM